ncbi:MAG: FKBP-type peptidyl-prolyl cis-trans isomerase [Bacteroidota bacterium]
MKINYILSSLIILLNLTSNAQADKKTLRIPFQKSINCRIGEKLPDFGDLKLINSASQTINLKDFKDKLLILDFWGTLCTTCINEMPHMQSLQAQFKDSVLIMPLANGAKGAIEKFWKENEILKELTIPSIVEGEQISDFFNHTGVPHEVWIYKNKVIAITGSTYVNEKNISRILKGEYPNWAVKNDFFKFDVSIPLFKIDTNQLNVKSTKFSYAAVSDYKEIDGFSVTQESPYIGLIRDVNAKTIRANIINQPIYLSFIINWMNSQNMADVKKMIIPGSNFNSSNVIEWHVADHRKYLYDHNNPGIMGKEEGEWRRENGICFEAIYRDTGQSDEKVYEKMNADLQFLLGLDIHWVKRNELVWIVKMTGKTDKFLKRKSVLRNRRLDLFKLVNELNNCETNPYIFNESNYEGQGVMDLVINDWSDIPAVAKAVEPYGVILTQERRLVDRLVFAEVNGGLMVNAGQMEMAKKKIASQQAMSNPTPLEGQNFLKENEARPGLVKLPSGVQYKIVTQGRGTMAKDDDKVKIDYTGMLTNGKIFDSSFLRGRPEIMTVKETIAGWAEILKIMPVGSKWEVYLPSNMAYGTHTANGKIPRESALIFEIELLDVVK